MHPIIRPIRVGVKTKPGIRIKMPNRRLRNGEARLDADAPRAENTLDACERSAYYYL